MTATDLNTERFSVATGNDSIVVVQAVTHLPGGRSLDVSGLAPDAKVVEAGHIIIREDATGAVMPLGVSGGAYAALPEGCSYLGVLKATVPVRDAQASIVLGGVINAAASPYPVTDDIKEGLPHIQFIY